MSYWDFVWFILSEEVRLSLSAHLCLPVRLEQQQLGYVCARMHVCVCQGIRLQQITGELRKPQLL